MFKVTERLYFTEGRDRIVRHGDPAAAYLAFPIGEELSDEEATRHGVTQFYTDQAAKAAALAAIAVEKNGRRPVDKMAARPADK